MRILNLEKKERMSGQLPINAINNQTEFNNIGFKNFSYLGEGSFGVVLKCQYNNKDCAIKVLTVDKEEDKLNVLKEAIMGFELKQKMPKGIREHFTGVDALFVCNGFVVPPDITNDISSNDLKDKLSNATLFYIIVQEFIANASQAAQWVSNKTSALDPKVIQSIMFQLVFSLCYAQSILGFQHNDLKLQNLMFVENKSGDEIVKRYKLQDEDIFEYTIPQGGVSVHIIDLGSSCFLGSSNEPDFIRESTQATPGYFPFELLLLPAHYTYGHLRRNDTDVQSLFKIMINLIMHQRAQINAGGTVWKLVSTADDTKDYTEYDWKKDETDLLEPIILELLSQKKTLSTKKKGEIESEYKEEDATQDAKLLVMDLILLKKMEFKIEFPDNEGNQWGKIARFLPKMQTAAKSIFDIVTDGTNLNPILNKITYMNNTLEAVKDAFPDGLGLHFLKLLGSPFFPARRSFGLPSPFRVYSLANAVYHPFFAFEFWKQDTSSSTTVPLINIKVPMKEPLLDQLDEGQKTVAEVFSNAYLKQFEKMISAVPKKQQKNDNSSDDSDVTSTGGKKKKEETTTTTTTQKNDAVEWTEKFVEDLNTAKARLLREIDVLNAPQEVVEELRDPPVLKALIKILEPTKIDEELPSGKGSGEKLAKILWKIIQAKKGAPQKPIIATGGYKVWTQKDFDDLEITNISKFSKEDYYSMSDEQLDSLNVKGNEDIFKELAKYVGIKLAARDQTKPKIIAALKSLFASERAKRTGTTPKKAKSPIFEQLESIEHHPKFIIPEADNVFDTVAISDELYIPLREAVVQHPELAKVATHLGIEKPLFEYPLVDMTKRSNQVRYLHTLSVLAEMIESRDITQEKIERCFVEWPPTPQYRMGEINEI